MVEEQSQEAALAEQQEKVVETSVDNVQAVEKVAEEQHVETPPEPATSAMVGAIAQLAKSQADTNNLIAQQNQLLQSNLNEFSRELANTDVSAQRAAESAAATQELIEPEKEHAPDTGEKPADVQELPKKEIEQSKSKTWWFGKAALRHGKGR